MKKINIFIAILAMAALASCQKTEMDPVEKQDNTVEKVPMTFTASVDMEEDDTKVAIGSIDTENKKVSFEWKAGDEIAVYDGISDTPNLFTANSNGGTTTFSGTVSAGATGFIAVYPYDASLSMDFATGAGKASIPQEQVATAGSFDPDAFVMVGSSDATDSKIRFRLFGSLLSFSVDCDDLVAVQFSGSRPMTGSFTYVNAVGATGPGSVSTVNAESHKDVMLKAAAGTTFTRGETYYVYVRHTGSNSQEGFTAKLITSDARVATRTGSDALQLARKTLYPLGTFSDSNLSFGYDRYAVYQAGFDVTIAGKTYNKATDGEATLLATGTNFKTSLSTDSKKLFFVEAGANISNSSEFTVSREVVLASNDPFHPATYTGTSGKSFLLASGSLVLESLVVDMSAMTSGQFITKKDNDSDVDALIIERCDFKSITRPVYTPNSGSLLKGVNTIRFNGNRFMFNAADLKLITISSTAKTLSGYDSFEFTNNVFYTSSATALNSQVFDTSAKIEDESGDQTLVLSNNLFYNIAASNGYFRSWNISSAEVNGNIAWIADDTSIGSNAKFIRFSQPTTDSPATFSGSASNNYCFGTLTGTSKWAISDAKDRSGLANVTTLASNPIASFDTATGVFELVDDYKAYGPQIQPM